VKESETYIDRLKIMEMFYVKCDESWVNDTGYWLCSQNREKSRCYPIIGSFQTFLNSSEVLKIQ
jgi:hypothetical protein